ncbi:unnamed protein product [Mesocestoides corti]|uniref:C2 domain-containing protein n=1 Tax=Mesocestoides corti TaxID=53468 RepID=A0A0R3UGZ1_MESCO|nr:unnamed protein product [Mesocestoides corti]
MSQQDRYLIVLSLISGRNFADKSPGSLVVEAKLDGEVLVTDPVAHTHSPQFDQELAWEVDRQTLKQHRLHRSSIKLQLFSVEGGGSSKLAREPLGYVVLDVRSASERQVYKWFQVLSSRCRPSPEVYCGLYIDQEGASDGAKCVSLEVKRYSEPGQSGDGEIIQIGPTTPAVDDFALSISVVSFLHLLNLLPSDLVPASSLSNLRLGLRFAGQDYSSAVFNEQDCTKLTANQWTFTIRSTVDFLRAYFSQDNAIGITFFLNDKPIGRTQSNLSSLGYRIGKSLPQPINADATFTLSALQGQGTASLVLQFNLEQIAPMKSGDAGNETTHVTDEPSTQQSNNALSTIESSPEEKIQQLVSLFLSSLCEECLVLLFCLIPPIQNDECLSPPTLDIDRALGPPLANQQSMESTNQGTSSTTAFSQAPPGATQPHRFCYTIELRTIRACYTPENDVYVYARYVYPLFGTTNPIMTLPPIQLSSSEAKHFSQGLCAFELAADSAEFKSRLSDEPLMTQILARSPGSGSEESLIGWAIIPLADVFTKPVADMKSWSSTTPATVTSTTASITTTTTNTTITTTSTSATSANTAVTGTTTSSSSSTTATTSSSINATTTTSITTASITTATTNTTTKTTVTFTSSSTNATTTSSSSTTTSITTKTTATSTTSTTTNTVTTDVSFLWKFPIGVTLYYSNLLRLSTTTAGRHGYTEAPTAYLQQPGDHELSTGQLQPLTNIRHTPEYRAALELELWKAKEEESFKTNLKFREQKMLVVFAEEWKRRENEREALCKKKIQEYRVLEDKLQNVLGTLMDREREFTFREAAFKQAQREYEKDLDRREKELMSSVKERVKEAEQALRVEQERSRCLSDELSQLREKYHDLVEKVAIEQRRPQTVSQEAAGTSSTSGVEEQVRREQEEVRRLQFELVRVTTELTSAQGQIAATARRLDAALRGRLRYKELWTRALHEVARLRQEAENTTKHALQRREAEVEGLRKEYRLLVHGGDTAVANNALTETVEDGTKHPLSPQKPATSDPVLEAQLNRLTEERQNLLASGVYCEEDELIVDLDREIKRLLGTMRR